VPTLVLSEIRERYLVQGRPLGAALEAALRSDPRAQAAQILAAIAKRRAANRAEGQRLRRLLRYETALWSSGVAHVAGVDEAGMSPLAGPVAAAAVILAPGTRLPEVDDSKKLAANKRERLAAVIQERSVAWAVGFAQDEEIYRINIYCAGLLAKQLALDGLTHAH